MEGEVIMKRGTGKAGCEDTCCTSKGSPAIAID
jgi:hypothetical protein